MGIMVYSLLWVMQDLYHQLSYTHTNTNTQTIKCTHKHTNPMVYIVLEKSNNMYMYMLCISRYICRCEGMHG